MRPFPISFLEAQILQDGSGLFHFRIILISTLPQVQKLLQGCTRLLFITFCPIGHTQITVEKGEAGIDLNRPLGGLDGLIEGPRCRLARASPLKNSTDMAGKASLPFDNLAGPKAKERPFASDPPYGFRYALCATIKRGPTWSFCPS
jgi:hypothetical protein